MLLSFQRCFESSVQDGSKTHTIRERRKNAIRVGDRLDLYVDSRKKSMRLIGRRPCTRIQEITITLSGTHELILVIAIDGVKLDAGDAEAFAWRDGFRSPGRGSLEQMLDFWQEHDRVFPWTGDLIHWDPSIAMPAPAKAAQRRRAA